MLTLKTDKEVSGIYRSFTRIFKHGDMKNLTKNAYNFIMLSSGFIAHYNIHGFRETYEDVGHFASKILSNQQYNQWDNFRPGERDYEYNMQKKFIYNDICNLAKQYLG